MTTDHKAHAAHPAPKADEAKPVAPKKVGPVSALDTFDTDPSLALFAKHAPETTQVGTGWDCFIGDGKYVVGDDGQPDREASIKHYVSQGYVPVTDGGKQVFHNGDPLFKKKVAE